MTECFLIPVMRRGIWTYPTSHPELQVRQQLWPSVPSRPLPVRSWGTRCWPWPKPSPHPRRQAGREGVARGEGECASWAATRWPEGDLGHLSLSPVPLQALW